MPEEVITYCYGAMEAKYELKATDKLVAYCSMTVHFGKKAHLMIIYSPLESYKDNWCNAQGDIIEKLDSIFGGEGKFYEFRDSHKKEIKECMDTIVQVEPKPV